MYLSNYNWGNIFVIEFKNEDLVQRQLLKFTLILGFCLLATTMIGQDNVTMRPGDINNDGRVSNTDALFWGEAYGTVGLERDTPTTDFWNEQTLPINLWEDSFYNGLNFSYADCNGDGIVDEDDFNDGIIGNLFENDNSVFPWLPGPPSLPGNPVLKLTSNVTQATGGQVIEMDISIESDFDIEKFIGAAFTITYPPTKIVDESIQFVPVSTGWLDEGVGVAYFSREQSGNEDGVPTGHQQTQIVIVRKGDVAPAGQGLIGKLSIVMEDIVIISTQIDIALENMVVLGEDLQPYLATGSSWTFNEQEMPTNTTEIDNNNLKVFPNPVEDIVRIESEDQSLLLENVEVIAANGQQVDYKNLKSQSISSIDLDWSKYASGLYFLKITTSEGMEVRKLTLAK